MYTETKVVRTKDLLSSYLSLKIRILSLLSVFLVVFHHAYNLDIGFDLDIINPVNFSIQHFISQGGVASAAVPFFFFISGILFFFNFTYFSYGWYLEKIKTRFKTLFIPYIFWSIFSLVIFFVLQSIPAIQDFFKTKIIDNSFFDLLFIIFLKPIAYQLWFVRDLLVLTIISPIIARILALGSFFNIIFLLILFLLWFIQTDLFFVSISSVLFFSLGAYLAIRKSFLLDKKFIHLFNPSFFLLIILIIIKIFLQYFANSNQIIESFIILLGVTSLWIGYDKYFGKPPFFIVKYRAFLEISPFFIYVAHEPLLYLVKNFLLFMLHYSDLARIIVYFAAPFLTLNFLFWINKKLISFHSNFYGLITGGRK